MASCFVFLKRGLAVDIATNEKSSNEEKHRRYEYGNKTPFITKFKAKLEKTVDSMAAKDGKEFAKKCK